LERYQSSGFTWVTYGEGDSNRYYPIVVKVRHSAQPRDFTLQVKATEEGAVIRLARNVTGEVLYEQNLRTIPPKNPHGSPEYCPTGRRNEGYRQAVLRALGQTGRPLVIASYPEIKPEFAHEPCDPGKPGIDGIKNLQDWDGRQVVLELGGLRRYRGFCSKSYIILASVDAPSRTPNDLQGEIYVFDRPTLQPLARFGKRNSCGSSCAKISSDVISGVRIANDYATVETVQGDVQAVRIER